MAEFYQESFFGVPVLSLDEQFELELELFRDELPSSEDTLMSKIVTTVIKQSPNIPALIDGDIYQTLKTEGEDDMSDEDKAAFGHGVYDGYEFVIAVVTYTRFLRARSAGFAGDIEDYLAEMRQQKAAPAITRAERQRLRSVRRGEAAVDVNTYTQEGTQWLDTSDELAEFDFGRYLWYSTTFEALVANSLGVDINEILAREDKGYWKRAGLLIGLSNAVEMYTQSYEHRALEPLEFSSPAVRGLLRQFIILDQRLSQESS